LAKLPVAKYIGHGRTILRAATKQRRAKIEATLGKATGTRGTLRGTKPGKRGKGKKGVSGGAKLVPPDKSAPTLKQLGISRKDAARVKRFWRCQVSTARKVPKEGSTCSASYRWPSRRSS
jgi:hypothetical protein